MLYFFCTPPGLRMFWYPICTFSLALVGLVLRICVFCSLFCPSLGNALSLMPFHRPVFVVCVNCCACCISFQLPWTSSSALEYLKLSRYLAYRMTFLAYLLWPTVSPAGAP